MSEEKKNPAVPVTIAAIAILLVLPGMLLFSVPVPDAVFLSILPSLALSLTFLPGRNRLRTIALVSAVLVPSLYSAASALMERGGAEGVFCILSMNVVPLIPILGKYGRAEVRKSRAFLVPAIAVLCYLGASRYYLSYAYLHYPPIPFDSAYTFTLVSLVSLALAALSSVLLDVRRNWFSVLCLLAGALSGGAGRSLSSNTPFLSFFTYPAAVLPFIFLYIYVLDCNERDELEERAPISFKGRVYEDIKPLKKRKRKKTFEIPPNVPPRKSEIESVSGSGDSKEQNV